MQKKSLTLITAFFFVCGLLFATGLSIASDAETAVDNGPAELELKTAAGKKLAKFPHKKHQEDSTCGECHHAKTDDGVKYSYVEGMEIKKCVTCHNKDDMVNPKLNSFKLAAHGLCKECHKQNKDIAPTKCSGCHPKSK